MTDTFAGILPRSVPLFILGQSLGGFAAALFARWLIQGKASAKPEPNGQ
jgi:hypothetical protein